MQIKRPDFKRYRALKFALYATILLSLLALVHVRINSTKTYLGRITHVERIDDRHATAEMLLIDGDMVMLSVDLTKDDGKHTLEAMELAGGDLMMVETRGVELSGIIHRQVIDVTPVHMIRDSHGTWYDEDGHPLDDV